MREVTNEGNELKCVRDFGRRKKLSITCACFNEVGNIRETYNQVMLVLEQLPDYDYEIIFADNHSTDGTRDILREISRENHNVKVIMNAANFGVARSGKNILRHVSGDVYVSIPADLQEPIEMIPEFLKYWEAGYDIVWGQKTASKENPIKYVCRSLYYNIIDMFSDYNQLHHTTGYGATDRCVLDTVLGMMLQDPEVYIRHLVVEYGFKMKLIPYTQRARKSGKSSYNIAGYYSFALTSLCSTSIKPLRLMTILGGLMGLGCVIVSIVYLIYKLTHWNTFSAGIAPIMIGLFFCSGVLLFCVGMIGEYISIILRRVTNRPVVVEEELINFDKDEGGKE